MPWTAAAAELVADPALTRAYGESLPGGRLAGPLFAYSSVPSTQTVCRRLAAAGAPEGLVIVADHQTEGRGRHGRVWLAPPGSALLVSCLLRPSLSVAAWPGLTLAAGCAVVDGIEEATGLAPRLKWPNDVVVADRKLAGILAEGATGDPPSVVLGIGVNAAQRPGDWPADLGSRAVSLFELGSPVPSRVLLRAILRRLDHWYGALLIEGFGVVREAWRRRAALGGPIRLPGIEGIALDLAPDGGLVVQRADGTVATLVADGTLVLTA